MTVPIKLGTWKIIIEKWKKYLDPPSDLLSLISTCLIVSFNEYLTDKAGSNKQLIDFARMQFPCQ